MADEVAAVPFLAGEGNPEAEALDGLVVDVLGEGIAAARATIAYDHRAVERWCEHGSYAQALTLQRPTCGICGHSHAAAFVRAVEGILVLDVPPRARALRTILAELERVRVHLGWLAAVARATGYRALVTAAERDAHGITALSGRITGSRPGRSLEAIGGLRYDIHTERLVDMERAVVAVEERAKRYGEVFSASGIVGQWLSGIGVLSNRDALRLQARGPSARASGVDADLRRDGAYGSYAQVHFDVVTRPRGDVLARAEVRIGEILESCSIIRHLTRRLPEGSVSVEVPRRVPSGEAAGRVESPSGEELQYVSADGSDMPARVEVRSPVWRVPQLLATVLEGSRLADLCLVVASMDPGLSAVPCPVVVREHAGRRVYGASWDALVRQGIEWYRRQGMDLSSTPAP